MLIITTTTCLATTTVLLLTGLLQSTCQAQTAPETAAPASTPFSPSPDCEASVLAALNESTAFQCHRLHIVWQPSFNPVWQNLSCLNSLTSLGITGALPDLPDAWSSSGSFPALQSLDLSGAFLAGMPAPTSTHTHPHAPMCIYTYLITCTSIASGPNMATRFLKPNSYKLQPIAAKDVLTSASVNNPCYCFIKSHVYAYAIIFARRPVGTNLTLGKKTCVTNE